MSATSLPQVSRYLVVQNHIVDSIDLSGPNAIFALKTESFPSFDAIPSDSIVAQTMYLSNDPGARLRIQKGSDSAHGRKDFAVLPLGSPMKGFAMLKVLAVGGDGQESSETMNVGDLVAATAVWCDFAVLKKTEVTKVVEIPGVSPSVYLGALGSSGWTAYWGLVDVLKPKTSDTLVVSGAAGGVGNVVVQYAKNVLGLKRVVAIAGSQSKCDWLRSIGADAAVNYKSPDFERQLEEATPEQVDIFFDNAGGSVLDSLLLRMRPHGKIAACGAMSYQSSGNSQNFVLKNYLTLIMNRLHLIGFTMMDYFDRMDEATAALTKAIKEGKLKIDGAETIVDVKGNIEDIPKVWVGLFEGTNKGKLVTKI